MIPKLSTKDTASILGVASITASRIQANDPTYPALERIGRSSFTDQDKFYSWLSTKADKLITPKDKLLGGNDLQDYYQKSHTWIWSHVKAGNLPKPFKINRTNYWLEREILGEVV